MPLVQLVALDVDERAEAKRLTGEFDALGRNFDELKDQLPAGLESPGKQDDDSLNI